MPTNERELADALRSATRAALLRLVPPGIFHASIVGMSSGESRAGTGRGDVLLTYSLAGRTGVLRVSGSPSAVQKDSDWRPARRASLVVLGCIGVAAAAVGAVWVAYSSQHEWFTKYGHSSVVGGLGLLGALALIPAVYGALLPREAWTIRTLWAPAMAALGLAFATDIACHIAGPTLRDALMRLQSGDQQVALVEAQALIASGIDTPGGRTVLDTVHLHQARATQSVEEIAIPLREAWYDDALRRTALGLLDDRVRNDSAATYAAGNATMLDRIADIANSFAAGAGATPHALASLVRTRTCGEQSDWGCATTEFEVASAAPAPDLAAVRDAVAEDARRELERLSQTTAPPGNVRAQRDRLETMISAAKCATDFTGQPTPAESVRASGRAPSRPTAGRGARETRSRCRGGKAPSARSAGQPTPCAGGRGAADARDARARGEPRRSLQRWLLLGLPVPRRFASRLLLSSRRHRGMRAVGGEQWDFLSAVR